MTCDFLVESYASGRVKALSVWSAFGDEDLPVRPRSDAERLRVDAPAYLPHGQRQQGLRTFSNGIIITEKR